MRTMILGLAVLLGGIAAAGAQQYLEFPAPTPFYPFQRSTLSGRTAFIPPYRRPFPVRVYSTPPKPPYYNVPPYAVVAPY